MKTKGHWVIKYDNGTYWCGNNQFDSQLRKAQIYHWKEYAEEQAAYIKRRNKLDETWEVIAVVPPQELKDTEAKWQIIDGDSKVDEYACSVCGALALHNRVGRSMDTHFCPHCGKRMINSTMEDDEYEM